MGWAACASIGAALVALGVASVSEYGVAAGLFLAVVWGPIMGLLASGALPGAFGWPWWLSAPAGWGTLVIVGAVCESVRKRKSN